MTDISSNNSSDIVIEMKMRSTSYLNDNILGVRTVTDGSKPKPVKYDQKPRI